jgi:thiamine pyrophosphokinase
MPRRAANSYYLDMLAPGYDALLMANGTPPNCDLLAILRGRCIQVIALDGGVNAIHRCRIAPDHVVGDFDSATPAALAWARKNGARIHRQPSTEEPDFLKGLALCKQLGLRRILGVSIVGGRLDHVLSAVYASLTVRGLLLDMVTDEAAVLPLRGRVHRGFPVPPHHTISWFPVPEAGPCSLSGVRWPFHNRMLRMGGFHSLSNQPTGSCVEFRQQAGRSVAVVSLFPQASR